jgi:UDP-N-acetylglucosamine acyltransferase
VSEEPERRAQAAAEIHPTAVVYPGARLAGGVVVGPYAVISGDVVLGPGTRIGPHVVIEDGVRLGADNVISAGATLGTPPQDRHFRNERSHVIIGDRNQIRECANISRGTGEGEATTIGDECFIMAFSHVGHNCRLGDRVVLVNSVQLGGHVHAGDDAYIGGLTGVHQFVHIGRLAMIGGASAVRQDVPPFMLAEGRPARCRGLNRVGLQRKGIDTRQRVLLRRAFRLLYQSGLPLGEAVDRLAVELGGEPLVDDLLAFLRAAAARARGVVRWARSAEE